MLEPLLETCHICGCEADGYWSPMVRVYEDGRKVQAPDGRWFGYCDDHRMEVAAIQRAEGQTMVEDMLARN